MDDLAKGEASGTLKRMRTLPLVTVILAVAAAACVAQQQQQPQTDKPAATSGHVVPKPKTVTREEWGSTPDPIPDSRKHTPEWITIHHAGVVWTNSGDPAVFVRNMQAWGKKRPQLEKPPRDTFWPDLPYHFLIAPDGRIFEGRPVEYEPETNTKYSVAGNIGVEMMGSFDSQRPSQAQLDSAVRLVAWLSQQHHIDLAHVRGHKDAAVGQTTCPGKDFYRYLEDGQFKRWVAAVQAGQEPNVKMGPPLPGGPTTLITDTRPAPKAATTRAAQ
jgi:hypothetical protein